MPTAASARSKSQKAFDFLKAAIDAGTYAEGARLPSETELSQSLAISKNTIREAVSILVQQGYLDRQQGKGTFVRRSHPASRDLRSVLIFTRANAHVFDKQTQVLVRQLQAGGVMPIVLDRDEFIRSGHPEMDPAFIEGLFAKNIDGVIVDETPTWLQAHCDEHQLEMPDVVVINHGDPQSMPTATYILPDLQAGTYLGARHLLELGHREILFVLHRSKWGNAIHRNGQWSSEYEMLLRGHRLAMMEFGLEDRIRYLFIDTEFRDAPDRERLIAILTGERPPTAVFCYGDYRAKCVIDIAGRLGMRIPDDLAVMGFYDTPWNEFMDIPLTTINIHADTISRLAAERLLGGPASPLALALQPIIVAPSLVIRQSCGAVARGLAPIDAARPGADADFDANDDRKVDDHG